MQASWHSRGQHSELGYGRDSQGWPFHRDRGERHLRELRLPQRAYPPFIDKESLSSPKRKLSVVCDVSCATTNPNNPIPIYTENSTFSNPIIPLEGYANPRLSAISIDHLPRLIPREASEAFSDALLPSLLQLSDRKNARVWKQAEELFGKHVARLLEDKQKKEL